MEGSRISEVRQGRDVPIVSGDWQAVDARGLYLSPGFIELHSHGAGGADFMDGTAEDIRTAAREHLRHGVTAILPTTLTSSMDDLFRTMDAFRAAQKQADGIPHLIGLHLEGPYFSMAQRGAQDPAHIKTPIPAEYLRILEYGQDIIARWTVAVELAGAMELGDELTRRGILASVGHSDAQLSHMREALLHGYTHVTHLYSGMSTITRERGFRRLGVLESALVLDELSVEIIADGCHIPPELLRFVWKVKGREKTCLVTDSMRCAGQRVSESILGSRGGGQAVVIEDGVAKLPDRTAFAASIATADRLLAVMHRQAGVPLEDCVCMITASPARVLGLENQKGALKAGYDADVVVLDDALTPRQVFVGGKRQFQAAGAPRAVEQPSNGAGG